MTVDQDGRASPGSLGLLCPGQTKFAEDTGDARFARQEPGTKNQEISNTNNMYKTFLVHRLGTPSWYTVLVHRLGTSSWYIVLVHRLGYLLGAERSEVPSYLKGGSYKEPLVPVNNMH